MVVVVMVIMVVVEVVVVVGGDGGSGVGGVYGRRRGTSEVGVQRRGDTSKVGSNDVRVSMGIDVRVRPTMRVSMRE